MTTLAFDVYGTLIDTAAVTTLLGKMVGDKAADFSNLWRQKQLEYTWRYGLMRKYHNFRICTSQALEFCCEHLGCELSAQDKADLMRQYLQLPVFEDVVDGLERLQSANVTMYAFSNGVPEDLAKLLGHAKIDRYLNGIVSVDGKQTFKPDPATYQHFLDSVGSSNADTWLISSNSFDVCGAVAAGMQALWLQRNPAVKFDHGAYQADKVATSFSEVADNFT